MQNVICLMLQQLYRYEIVPFLEMSVPENSPTNTFFAAMKFRTIVDSLLVCFTNHMQKLINVQLLTSLWVYLMLIKKNHDKWRISSCARLGIISL